MLTRGSAPRPPGGHPLRGFRPILPLVGWSSLPAPPSDRTAAPRKEDRTASPQAMAAPKGRGGAPSQPAWPLIRSAPSSRSLELAAVEPLQQSRGMTSAAGPRLRTRHWRVLRHPEGLRPRRVPAPQAAPQPAPLHWTQAAPAACSRSQSSRLWSLPGGRSELEPGRDEEALQLGDSLVFRAGATQDALPVSGVFQLEGKPQLQDETHAQGGAQGRKG